MNNVVTVNEKLPGEDALATCQVAEEAIKKISESVTNLRAQKELLELKEHKTDEEKAKLLIVEETLNHELEELNKQFELIKRLILEIQNDVTKISPKMAAELNKSLSNINNPVSCESEDFRQVIIFNHDNNNKDTALRNIMVMESMTDQDDLQTNCQSCGSSLSSSNNEFSNQCSNETCNNCNIPVNICTSDESDESYNLKIKNEISELKKKLEFIVNENQELRFQLESAINRNDVLAKSLERPAAFKECTVGGVKDVRFPGKKEMEEKLLTLKTEIVRLHKEIGEVQINKLRLKSAKHFINKYSSMIVECKCEDSTLKENININNLKVKKQQIEHIECQIKRKSNELNKIISDCEFNIKKNNKIIAKNQKIADNLMDVKKKIQGYDCNVDQKMIDDLSRINHEIVTLELVTAKNKEEIIMCNEKLNVAQHETREITSKTEKLEDSMKTLSEDFSTMYTNLESVYQEQLEEMLALPVLLKATHIKLQEDTDMRVLAEEARDKLERQIIEAESLKRPTEPEDHNDYVTKLETENELIISKLKYLEDNITSAKLILNNEIEDLRNVRLQVKNAIFESNKHIDAFKSFSKIQLDKIEHDVKKVQELLTELQSKQCAKALVKKTAKEHLKVKIVSINKAVEKCRLITSNLLDQLNLQHMCTE